MNTKPTTYFVCVDKREESRVALQLAALKAKVKGGSVDILHVLPPGDVQALQGIAERMREEQREEAEFLLKSLSVSICKPLGVTPNTILKEGEVGEMIVKAVEENTNASMLVIGVSVEDSGSRGNLVSWLAAQLGNKLNIPMLLVPGNLKEDQLEKFI